MSRRAAVPPSAAPAASPLRRVLLGLFAALCAGAGGLFAWQHRRAAASAEEDRRVLNRFLDHAWEDAEGRPLDAASLRGRVLLINFWATWCPPCVEEMPELDQLQKEWGPRDVQVLGIGIDARTKILDFSRRARFGYPLLVGGAEGSDLSRAFGNASAALPFTVLVGRDGQVRERILGRFNLPRLREAIEGAAGQASRNPAST